MISFLQSLRNRKNFLAFVQKLGTDKAGAYKGEQFCLIKKPTASEEARNETNPAYNLMIMHLTQAIANETIKMRWFDSYIAGFNQLIQDLIDKGPRHFFRIEENDANFKGPKGGLYWESFVKYVNASGPTRLDKLFEQFSKMPPEVTLAEIFKKNFAMEHKVLLLSSLLLSSAYLVDLAPVREKISINTELLNKVRETPTNNTEGGREGIINNFARRITVIKTTSVTKPVSLTTMDGDELAKEPDMNQLLHKQLTHTLKDAIYRKKWKDLTNVNYTLLITEMRRPGACKIFIKDNHDGAFEGPKGEKLYVRLVNFLEAIGKSGFRLISESVNEEIPLPDEMVEKTTTTPTTTTTEATTTKRTTLSVKDIEKDPQFFEKVYVQLSVTLKTKQYRDMWQQIVQYQGYMSLLEEMRKPGAHKIFMRDNGDNAWKGPEGVTLYEATVNFLHTIGRAGFNTLLESIDEIPLSPGEALGNTPPPPVQPETPIGDQCPL
ncbi:hypothetical protein WDU94_001752 [Cyamophila willieti]